jgi:hypothetical protein
MIRSLIMALTAVMPTMTALVAAHRSTGRHGGVTTLESSQIADSTGWGI